MCGNARTTDPSVSVHRFLKEQDRRALWLSVFELSEDNIKANTTRVCSRHFPDGESKTSIYKFKALTPLQSNHHRSAAAVCLSYGSSKWAPGMSESVRITTGRPALMVVRIISITRQSFNRFSSDKLHSAWKPF